MRILWVLASVALGGFVTACSDLGEPEASVTSTKPNGKADGPGSSEGNTPPADKVCEGLPDGFEGCGGEIRGTWTLVKNCSVSLSDFVDERSLSGLADGCPSATVEHELILNADLEVTDATVTFSGRQGFIYTDAVVPNACLAEEGVSCEQLSASADESSDNVLSCEADGDTCACERLGVLFDNSADTVTADSRIDGDKVILVSDGQDSDIMLFCVTGNQLVLQLSDNSSGELIYEVYKRVP